MQHGRRAKPLYTPSDLLSDLTDKYKIKEQSHIFRSNFLIKTVFKNLRKLINLNLFQPQLRRDYHCGFLYYSPSDSAVSKLNRSEHFQQTSNILNDNRITLKVFAGVIMGFSSLEIEKLLKAGISSNSEAGKLH